MSRSRQNAPRRRRYAGAGDVRGFGGLEGLPLLPIAIGAGILALYLNRKAITEAGGYLVSTLTGIVDHTLWAKRLYDVIGAELPQLSVSAKATMVAHAAYESGWGQATTAARTANNLFNLTAGSAWRGPVFVQANADLSYNLTECAKKGRTPTQQANGKMACRIDQTWRSYPSINAAVRDYWDFLGPNQNSGRYISARLALENGNVADFGQRLYTAGYFTLPPNEYIATLTSIVGTIKRMIG